MQQLPFYRRIGAELLALAVCIPLTIVLGAVLFRFPSSPAVPQSSASPSAPQQTVSPTPSSSPMLVETLPAGEDNTLPAEKTVTVVLLSPAKGTTTYTVPVTGTPSVIDVLQTLSRTEEVQLTTKDFGQLLGLLVESLQGIKNNDTPGYYWQLYVNTVYSPLGASSVHVKAGDTIRWEYAKERKEEGV